jgi:hypothetical protein
VASPSEKKLMDTIDNDNDEDMDVMGQTETHPASPSDQTLLTQEFASPASASVSSAATRSSSRNDNGNGSSRVDRIRDNHASPSDKDNDENGDNDYTASSPQCLTQDPETTRQDQAVDNQDDLASPSAKINSDDNYVDNNDGADSATGSDDDDDDDDSSEEDDDDENEINPNTLSLMDRRELNLIRNKAFAARLDLANGITPKRKPPADNTTTTLENGEDDPEEPTKRRGMLLSPSPSPTTTTTTTTTAVPNTNAMGDQEVVDNVNVSDDRDLDGLASLQSMFCHRQAPIRKLYSVLAAAASQSQSPSQSGTLAHSSRSCSRAETTSRFVPAPIIVTGSSGSGKTAILRATVHAIEKGNRVPAVKGKVKDSGDGTQVVSAYINCATLDVASIDELVTHAHNQFQTGIQKLSGNSTVRKKGRSKRHKKKRKKSSVVTDQAGKE